MSGTWASSWALNDIVSVAEFAKGIGAVADSTLGAGAASIDLTGLPTTYAQLRILIQARGDTAAANIGINLRLNNDSAANYGSQYVRGLLTTASANESISQTSALIGSMAAATATGSHASAWEIIVPNYGATTFFKSWSSFGGWTQAITTNTMAAQANTGVWASTAAINRVTLLPSAGNFVAGTRVTVYVMGA